MSKPDAVAVSVPPARHGVRDAILFIGMNPDSAHELRALRKSGSQVETLTQKKNKATGDFSSSEGISAFVAGLRLDAPRAAKLEALLNAADEDGRDELAGLAKLFSSGRDIPGRLVLSGHSDGMTIWGEDGSGTLAYSELGELADLFPKAAAQIEDIHIGGCNAGYKSNLQALREHFPKLKTFWSYTHTAPSGINGAPQHLKAWEEATAGDTTKLNRREQVQGLKGVTRAGNVAVWSRSEGYQSRLPANTMSIEEIELVVENHRLGEARSSNPQAGPLKQAYDSLQTLRGNSQNEEDIEVYDGLIDQALRLRFYDKLSDNFQQAFGVQIKQAYETLGLAAPDFGKLGRKGALAAIRQFDETLMEQRLDDKLTGESLDLLEKAGVALGHLSTLDAEFFSPEWTDPLTPEGIERAREQFELLEAAPTPSADFDEIDYTGLGGLHPEGFY